MANHKERIRKLFSTKEYEEFKDEIELETPFTLLHELTGQPVRLVYLGLTKDSMLLARQEFSKCTTRPWIVYNATEDVEKEWWEYEWIIPLRFISITQDKILQFRYKSNVHIIKVGYICENDERIEHFLFDDKGSETLFNPVWENWLAKIILIRKNSIREIRDQNIVQENNAALQLERQKRQEVAFEQLTKFGAGNNYAYNNGSPPVITKFDEFLKTMRYMFRRICAYCFCGCQDHDKFQQ